MWGRMQVIFPGKLVNNQSLFYHQCSGLKKSVLFSSVVIYTEQHDSILALDEHMNETAATDQIENAHEVAQKLFELPVTLR